MDSLLKASYQNMILADTIRIEQPQSVSVLQLENPKNLATPENVKKLSKVVLGTNKYDHLIKNYKNEKWTVGDTYGFNYDSRTDSSDIAICGIFVMNTKLYLLGAYGIRNIYHPDWGIPLGNCTLNGKKCSLTKQYQYVENWAKKMVMLSKICMTISMSKQFINVKAMVSNIFPLMFVNIIKGFRLMTFGSLQNNAIPLMTFLILQMSWKSALLVNQNRKPAQ